jgi:hypothetical protein
MLLMMCFVIVQPMGAAEDFTIKGYSLGRTPEEFGIELEINEESGEVLTQVMTADFVDLFFVRVGDSFRLYRIRKEEAVEKEKMDAHLQDLKIRYGIPKLQHIETSYSKVNPKRMRYVFSATNKATWKISETQEFIAWIALGRIVYELLDHDPQKNFLVSKPDTTVKSEPTESQTGVTEKDKPKEEEPEDTGWESDF